MTRALCLILGLVIVAPVLTIVTYEWYVYLVLLLFLRGVIVIVVYFRRLRTFIFKLVKGTNLLFFLLVFNPFILEFEVMTNVIWFFFNYRWYILVYLLVKLVGLMLTTSYFLYQKAAIRRLWGSRREVLKTSFPGDRLPLTVLFHLRRVV